MATVPKSSRVLETTLASASAGPFALGFRVFDTDGFDVYVDGVRQTVSTDYSVSASFSDGYDDAATITFTETLDIGTEIVVYGKMVADRETDYSDGDANLTLKLNTELARIAAMLSEMQRDIAISVRVIGSDDGALTAVASGILAFDASGNLTVASGSASTPVSVAMADVVGAETIASARAELGVSIGSDVQAYDAGLASISGLTTAADRMIYTTASDTYAVATLTAAGRALIDDANASAQRATLGLGTMALQDAPTGNAQTGTTYTLALSDANDSVTMDNASANALTIPAEASVAFPINTVISIIQLGAGATTVTGDTGVTVNGVSAGSATLLAQHAAVSLLKVASDTWNLAGAHGGVS